MFVRAHVCVSEHTCKSFACISMCLPVSMTFSRRRCYSCSVPQLSGILTKNQLKESYCWSLGKSAQDEWSAGAQVQARGCWEQLFSSSGLFLVLQYRKCGPVSPPLWLKHARPKAHLHIIKRPGVCGLSSQRNVRRWSKAEVEQVKNWGEKERGPRANHSQRSLSFLRTLVKVSVIRRLVLMVKARTNWTHWDGLHVGEHSGLWTNHTLTWA